MSAEWLVRHAWWSLRRRARLALLIVAGHAIAVVLLFVSFGGTVPADWEMSVEDRASVEGVMASPYADYLRDTWSGDLAGLLAVLAVALAVGGVAVERRQGTLDLTLSLPIARSRWLLVRWALVLALVLLLALGSTLVVAAGGLVLEGDVPGRLAAWTVLAGGAVAGYAAAATIMATTWARDSIVAALAALALLYVTGGGAGGAAGWAPGQLLGPDAWAQGLPWRPLASTTALTAAFLMLAVQRFTRIGD